MLESAAGAKVMKPVDERLAAFERRLGAIRMGAERRAQIFRSFQARIDDALATRRRKLSDLEGEIAALESEQARGRDVYREVEARKRSRRTIDADGDALARAMAALETRGDGDLGSGASPKSTRFSDTPKVRSADGLTWANAPCATKLDPATEITPFTDFVNPEIEVILRNAGALHMVYLYSKERRDVQAIFKHFLAVDVHDDLPIKAATCGVVYDIDAAVAGLSVSPKSED